MRPNDALSIVVPTLNEAGNVWLLVERIAAALVPAAIPFEILFIDDHSTDGTLDAITALKKQYATQFLIRYELKVGKRGKAYSLLQGFASAKMPLVCMIDADLQYPPESIATMYQLLYSRNADIVITDRIQAEAPLLRRLGTRVFNYVFVRLLFGFDYDTQSGMKLFKKDILKTIVINPKPWSFDLEFIVRALEGNYRIARQEISFSARHSGKAKINLLTSTFELSLSSIRLRASSSRRRLKQMYRSSNRTNQVVEVITLAVIAASLLSTTHVFAQSSAARTPAAINQVSMQNVSNSLASTIQAVQGAINQSLQPSQPTPTTPVSPTPTPAEAVNSNQAALPTATGAQTTTNPETITPSTSATLTNAPANQLASQSNLGVSAQTSSDATVSLGFPASNGNQSTSAYYASLRATQPTNNLAKAGLAALVVAVVIIVTIIILSQRMQQQFTAFAKRLRGIKRTA